MDGRGGWSGDPTGFVFRSLGDILLGREQTRENQPLDADATVYIHRLRRHVGEQKEIQGVWFSVDRSLEELRFLGLVNISSDARKASLTPAGRRIILGLIEDEKA